MKCTRCSEYTGSMKYTGSICGSVWQLVCECWGLILFIHTCVRVPFPFCQFSPHPYAGILLFFVLLRPCSSAARLLVFSEPLWSCVICILSLAELFWLYCLLFLVLFVVSGPARCILVPDTIAFVCLFFYPIYYLRTPFASPWPIFDF